MPAARRTLAMIVAKAQLKADMAAHCKSVGCSTARGVGCSRSCLVLFACYCVRSATVKRDTPSPREPQLSQNEA
jgi:hypothetical protein